MRDRTVALLLLLALTGICIYSYLTLDANLPHPGAKQVRENYASCLRREVLLFGDVIESSENVSTILDEGLSFQVFGATAQPGDKVEVLGLLKENYRVLAQRVVVYGSVGYSAIFLRSLLGAGVLMACFFRKWRFKNWRFREVE
jgi:hypothetical protein